MKRWMSTLLLWPTLALAALPAPPPPLELTAEEQETIADRDIAIRLDETDSGGTSIGIIDVNASPRATIDAVLDLPPRVNETGALKEVTVTSQAAASGGEPEKLSARFALKVMFTNVVFHVNYEIDRDAGWAVSVLDETQENDIVSAYSSYQVIPTETGSRIIYRTRSDSGRSVPDWVKTWLANNALKDQLSGIRARAEAS